MGVVADLLNAQRRPDHEAARLTSAISKTLNTDTGAQTASEFLSAVSESCEQVSQDIAYEKLPRSLVSDSAGDDFGDEGTEDETLSDVGHDNFVPLGADDHYLLDGDDGEEPSPEDAPDHGGHEFPSAAEEGDGGPTAAQNQLHGDPDEDFQGGPTADDDDSGEEFPGADHGDAAAVADDSIEDDDVDSEPEELESSTEPEPDGGAEPNTADSADHSQPTPVVPPSPLDDYAAPPSPWDDQEELPVDSDGVTDGPEHDGTVEDEDIGDSDDSDIAPSDEATAPPDDFDAPSPQPEAGIKERAVDRFGAAMGWVRSNHKKARLYGAIAGGVLLAVAGLLVSISGNRGRPPLPKNEIITQHDIDNPETKPDTKTLIPETVSASCGNDSDAVGPFSANKSRAWVCTRINGIDLNVLNITFSAPVIIENICLVPGWDYVAPDGRDEWSRHRLISSVSWRMGGKVYPQKITPTRPGVCKDFPAVVTKEMSMTITASTRPVTGEPTKGAGIGGAGEDDASKVDETTAVGSIVIKGRYVNPNGG